MKGTCSISIPSNYLVLMTALGSRVRGLKSKLLSKEKLKALIMSESLDDLMTLLRDSSYKAAVEKFGKEISSSEFIREVKTLVIKDIAEVASAYPLTVGSILTTYLLKFEIENIKTIAKGLYEGKDRREIEKLVNIHVAEILGRRHVIAYLLGARDLEDLGTKLKELAHPAYEVFEHIIKLSKLRPELTLCAIDTLLDRVYLTKTYEMSRGICERDLSLVHVIRAMINYYNFNILLRGKLWNLPLEFANEFVIKMGTLGTMFTRYYGETITRILDDFATDPLISSLLSITKVTELDQAVHYLGLAYFRAFREITTSILSRYGEFSPGSALAICHLRDLESELIITLVNAFIEGVPKDVVRRYLLAVI